MVRHDESFVVIKNTLQWWIIMISYRQTLVLPQVIENLGNIAYVVWVAITIYSYIWYSIQVEE